LTKSWVRSPAPTRAWCCWKTIPGIGPLLGLTIAAEVGDIARFGSARKLVGYAGLAPKIKQSGQSSRIGPRSKAGSKTLRWAAVEAAQQAWRETNPWHELYRDVAKRQGKTNAARPPSPARS
jgi:transposase